MEQWKRKKKVSRDVRPENLKPTIRSSGISLYLYKTFHLYSENCCSVRVGKFPPSKICANSVGKIPRI